jgi:integrase
MAREIHRLSALAVNRASEPRYYPDGDGLYLQVSSTGTKSWIYRYSNGGRSREMGLGALSALSLSDARARVKECRQQRLMGVDPLEAKRTSATLKKLEAAKAVTFSDAATRYIAAHEASWGNEKHRAQWKSTLEIYATPVIGALSVATIDTGSVLKIIEPIWRTKPETASRVRGRIESVLNWAIARGFRQGDNPARWKGHLDKLLPARGKVRTVKHHAALPFDELPIFMTNLRSCQGSGARALELTILTGLRTGEVIGACWREFNLRGKLWIVPAERMKAKREHRVPLSDYVVDWRPFRRHLTFCFLVSVTESLCRIWRCSRRSTASGAVTSRSTVSAAPFAIGQPSGPIFQITSWKWRLPTLLVTRLKQPIVEATFSRSACGSWMLGRNSRRRRQKSDK